MGDSKLTKVSVDEIRKVTLDIYSDFKKFCAKNGLKHWVAYGTLLGAIRHKGFIPWDDDFDVFMPRQDFDTFLTTFENKINFDSRLELLHFSTRNNYPYGIARLSDKRYTVVEKISRFDYGLGIWIDIYPLDGVNPGDEKLLNYAKRRRTISYLFHQPRFLAGPNKIKNILKLLVFLYTRMLKMNKYFFKTEKMIKKRTPSFFESEKCCCLIWCSPRVLFNTADFGRTIELEFENIKVCVPFGYDNILKKSYGDYMVLPPKDKRTSYHLSEVYKK